MILIVEPRRARLEVLVQSLSPGVSTLGLCAAHLLHLLDVARVSRLVVSRALILNGLRVEDNTRADSLTKG